MTARSSASRGHLRAQNMRSRERHVLIPANSPGVCRQHLVEPGARCCGQPLALPMLDDAALLQDHHLVTAVEGGEPVCDHDHGTALDEPVHGALYEALSARIYPRRGLVEDDHARVAEEDPRESQELGLAGRHARSLRPHYGIEAVRQVRVPAAQAELLHHLDHPLVGDGPGRAASGCPRTVPSNSLTSCVTTPTWPRSWEMRASRTSSPPRSTRPRSGS